MKVPVFQLLTASFTLKIEKGNKIAFLDMPFTMEPTDAWTPVSTENQLTLISTYQ